MTTRSRLSKGSTHPAACNHSDGLVKKNDAANLVAAETALAGSMGRPQHMPHAKFDAQAAQIAALGAQTRRGNKVAPKRKRPQLEE